jgi:nicotinamidase-related amidase
MNDETPSATNSAAIPPSRSFELMNCDDTALLVVDVQTKLLAAQPMPERLVWNCRRLVDGAAALGVVAAATVQNPEKLGPLVEPLAAKLPPAAGKLAFSCWECGEIFKSWRERNLERVLICGIETHVCVQQTALDLLGAGFRVYVAVDAVSSRHVLDYETALGRMDSAGATLTTVEAALFEWCGRAGTDAFRKISALAKETPPEE